MQAADFRSCLLWACHSVTVSLNDRLPQMCPAYMQVVRCLTAPYSPKLVLRTSGKHTSDTCVHALHLDRRERA